MWKKLVGIIDNLLTVDLENSLFAYASKIDQYGAFPCEDACVTTIPDLYLKVQNNCFSPVPYRVNIQSGPHNINMEDYLPVSGDPIYLRIKSAIFKDIFQNGREISIQVYFYEEQKLQKTFILNLTE